VRGLGGASLSSRKGLPYRPTPLVGPGLEVDAYDDWGFLAIALVQTESLRPQGFPRWLGRDFFLSPLADISLEK
jgi:hypothetical protein